MTLNDGKHSKMSGAENHGVLRDPFVDISARNAYSVTADDLAEGIVRRVTSTGRDYIAISTGAGAGSWRLVGDADAADLTTEVSRATTAEGLLLPKTATLTAGTGISITGSNLGAGLTISATATGTGSTQVNAVATRSLVGLTTATTGTLGVGATLTFVGVPAASYFDGVPIGANNLIVIPPGLIETGREGVWKVTTATGNAVLTRDTNLDTAAKIINQRFQVLSGARERLHTWACVGTGATIDGTAQVSIMPIGNVDPTIVLDIKDDFTRLPIAIVNGTLNIGDAGWSAILATGATITAPLTGNDDQIAGYLLFHPGSTATGNAELVNTNVLVRIGDPATQAEGRVRFKTPSVSSAGVQEFNAGVSWTAGGAYTGMTDGVAIYVRGSDNHIVFVTANASSRTISDTGVVVSGATLYDCYWVRPMGQTGYDVYVNSAKVLSNVTTNIPATGTRVFTDIEVIGVAGTSPTLRQVLFDFVQTKVTDPKGRAG